MINKCIIYDPGEENNTQNAWPHFKNVIRGGTDASLQRPPAFSVQDTKTKAKITTHGWLFIRAVDVIIIVYNVSLRADVC